MLVSLLSRVENHNHSNARDLNRLCFYLLWILGKLSNPFICVHFRLRRKCGEDPTGTRPGTVSLSESDIYHESHHEESL